MSTATAEKLEVITETLVIQDLGRFTEMLGTAVGALGKESHLPILQGVFVEAQGTSLTITGSDSTSAIRSREVDVTNVMGSTRFVVSGKMFYELVKKLPKGEVEIVIEEDKVLTLRVKVGKKYPFSMELQLMEADQYPAYTNKKLEQSFSVNAKKLAAAIKATVYAADKKDDSHILSGIHIKGDGDKLRLIATDRHRVSSFPIHLDETIESFAGVVVPGHSSNEMRKMLENIDDEVTVEFSESEMQFSTENLSYKTKLLSGNYPDVSKVIPQQVSTETKVKRTDLLSALERAALLVTKYKTCLMEVSGDSIEISARADGETMKSKEAVATEESTGNVRIGMDVFYLADALKGFNSEHVKFGFTGPLSPLRIDPVQDGDCEQLALVIPVRINREN